MCVSGVYPIGQIYIYRAATCDIYRRLARVIISRLSHGEDGINLKNKTTYILKSTYSQQTCLFTRNHRQKLSRQTSADIRSYTLRVETFI